MFRELGERDAIFDLPRAKFFTGLPLDGPDPECVGGEGEQALASITPDDVPRPMADHSKPPRPIPVALGRK